jgi:hypothetical protein
VVLRCKKVGNHWHKWHFWVGNNGEQLLTAEQHWVDCHNLDYALAFGIALKVAEGRKHCTVNSDISSQNHCRLMVLTAEDT